MNIQVYPHRIILNKTNEVNSGEYNVNECTFEFSQEYEGLTKVAVFSLCDGTTKNVTILNNQCIIPVECLQETGQVQIGVYGYATQDNELVLRYSPTPQNFVVRLGSYKEGTQPVAPTPTDWEILVEQVSDIAEDVSSIHEDITGINGEISGINIDIRDLQDTKANISDLAEVAFTGEFSDLKNIPSYATTQQLNQEIQDRQDADVNLQSQIDAISVSSDVVDVVGTYQELLDYDTTHLKDNDIVKVLQDSTHSDALSYYRWDKETSTWSYVGSEGPFYTKSETDALLNDKQDVIDIDNMLSSDLVDDTNSTNKFVTQADITNWNNKEDKSNKVTEINSSSTDTQYPSAKCVYDSQEKQNEQLAELEMLYNAFPTVIDEDTTIELNNTAKVKFREIDLKGNTSQVVIPEEQGTSVSNTSIYVSDVNTDKENTIEISGNTYQETTTGKNLANFIDSQVYNYNNGVPSTISRASVISNKTNNSYNIKYGTNSFLGVVSNTMEFEENTDYVFSFNRPYKSNFTQRIHILQVNNDDSYTLLQAINAEVYGTPYTYTYSNTTAKKVAFMISTNNSNPKDETETISEIMVRKSTTTDTYEPFTNGASPNPNYPQNIEVVTGTQNVKVCGKNLFDKNNADIINAFLNDSGFLQANGNYRSIIFPTNTNTTYAISKIEGKIFRVAEYKTLPTIDSNWTNRIRNDFATNIIYTTSSTGNYIVITYKRETDTLTEQEILDSIQIEQGSTATTYEAYQGTTYPVNLGNIELCKIDTYKDRIYKSNGKWYLEKQIGKVVFNGSEEWINRGTATTGYSRFVVNLGNNIIKTSDATEKAKIFSNKFIGISRTDTYNRINGFAPSVQLSDNYYRDLIFYYSNVAQMTTEQFKIWLASNNILLYYVLATPTTTEITDTTLVNQLNALYNATIYPITNINTDTSNLLPYIYLHYNFVTPSPSPSRPSVVNVVKGNNTITISNSDNTESQVFPINLGDMELCKINTYQDYIYESNGNWFKKGNINKNVVNTNNVTLISSYTNIDYAAIPKQQDDIGYGIYSNAETFKCNVGKYISSPTWDSNTNIGRISGAANKTAYWLGFEKGTSLDTIKTILANDNATMYYTLATPTDTQITDTTLITQLNNIKKAYSYDTQTNISQTNADKPFIIYAEAIRSLKDVFE